MGIARNIARLIPNGSGELPTANIANDAISAAKIAANAVTGVKLASGAVVVQTQQIYQTSAFSTTSTSYVDFLTVTITPTKTSNRMVIHGAVLGGSGEHSTVRVTRNGTEIPNNQFYDGYSFKTLTISAILQSVANNGQYGSAFSFYDSPSSTSAVTYKIQVAVRIGGTFTVGRNVSGDTNYAQGQNFLQVMEISG